MKNIPLARRQNLVVDDLSDEVIVYDQVSHRICHLNRDVAFVWRHCDGNTPAEMIVELLENELNIATGKETLTRALDYLEKHDLLQMRAVGRARAHAA